MKAHFSEPFFIKIFSLSAVVVRHCKLSTVSFFSPKHRQYQPTWNITLFGEGPDSSLFK